MNKRPRQKLSYKEKAKNDFEWAKSTIDFYAGGSTYNNFYDTRKSVEEYYDYYNNKFPDKFFTHITNPLNTNRTEHQKFPAKLRNFTILRPNIDLLIGEYRKRGFDYTVNVNNPDAISKKLEAMNAAILQSLQDMFMEEVDSMGRTPELPEKIKDKFNNEYKDERAKIAQNALDYLSDFKEIPRVLADAVKDFVISGTMFTYKDIVNGEIVYKSVNPLNTIYDDTVEFFEDGEFFVNFLGENGSGLSASQIIDLFYEDLTEEEIDKIEGMDNLTKVNNLSNLSSRYVKYGGVEVVHVTWKSFRKIKSLKYNDPITGESLEMEVDESYVLKQGEKANVFWINEVWEGYRIAGDIYKKIGPIACQRNEMLNKSHCKLPYNGRCYSNKNSENISILQFGIPYQILYIATMYNIEKAMNKNKGKIVILDKNVIPIKGGWDEEKFFWVADALGYNLIDRNQPNVDKSYNQYQVLDLSTINEVMHFIKLLEAISDLWDKTLGFTPQRKGQVSTSAGLGTTERAVFQSSVISEELFSKIDEFAKREFEGLIDVSKLAWKDGKKAIYAGSDFRNKVLDIDPEVYVESDYFITVSNNSKSKEILEIMKETTQAFAQNQHSPKTILEILSAKSPSVLKELLDDVELKMQEMRQQQSEQEQQITQMTIEAQERLKQLEHVLDIEKMNIEFDRKERLELLKVEASLITSVDSNDDGKVDVLDIEKNNIAREKMYLDLQAKREANAAKIEAEKIKADTAIAVAKQNKNKYDK